MASKIDDERSVKSYEEAPSPLKQPRIVQSPGVQRISAVASTIDLPLKIALFISIFFLSYVYGLGESSWLQLYRVLTDVALRRQQRPFYVPDDGHEQLRDTLSARDRRCHSLCRRGGRPACVCQGS